MATHDTLEAAARPFGIDEALAFVARGGAGQLRRLRLTFEHWNAAAYTALVASAPQHAEWTEEQWYALLKVTPQPVPNLPAVLSYPLENLLLALDDRQLELSALEELELVGRFDESQAAHFGHLGALLERCPKLRSLAFVGDVGEGEVSELALLDSAIIPTLWRALAKRALEEVVFSHVWVDMEGRYFTSEPTPRMAVAFDEGWAQDWVPADDPGRDICLSSARVSKAPLGLMRIEPFWQRNVMRRVRSFDLQESAIYEWLAYYVTRFAPRARSLVMRGRVILNVGPPCAWGTPDIVFNAPGEQFYVPNQE